MPPEDSGWFGYDEFPPPKNTPVKAWYCVLCQTHVVLPADPFAEDSVKEAHFAGHVASLLYEAEAIIMEAAE